MAPFAGSRKPYFEVRESPIQGKGAFAIRRIPKGTRIIEYIGECIDEDEADIRYPDDEMERHHTFLFAVDGGKILDGGPVEWPAKYINHSCDPNCEAIEEDDGRVFVHAIRAIQPGAELTYDYAYERTEATTEADELMYKCLCGSKNCRGTILKPAPTKKKAPARKAASRKGGRKAAAKHRAVSRHAGRHVAGGAGRASEVLARKAGGRKRGATRKTSPRKAATRKKTGARKSSARRTRAR